MVVVAGGSGVRFGGRKQYAELLGRPLLTWAIEAARSVADGVVVVLPADDLQAPPAVGSPWPVVDAVVAGGATRSASVRAGLAAVAAEAAVVVVHDAVRPLASPRLFRRVVGHLADHAEVAAVVPTVPVVDTLKAVDGQAVVATVDRQRLAAVQTPQAFRADVLRRAHQHGADATDDAALVELVGGTVHVVEGERSNVKVTTPEDVVVAAALATSGLVAGLPVGDGPAVAPEVGRGFSVRSR